MSTSLSLGFAALAAHVPALIHVWRRTSAESPKAIPMVLFWMVLLVAIAGSAGTIGLQMMDGWHGGIASTIWISVAASLFAFGVCTVISADTARLSPLMFPYMALLTALALLLTSSDPGTAQYQSGIDAWLGIHIVVSISTYAVVTVAAIAGLAAFLQERALKTKSTRGFVRHLPALAFSDRMTVRLLAAGELILGLGIASGFAQSVAAGASGPTFDHKTILSILAFAVIGMILWSHHKFGLRGQRAARGVLLAYLLLTLGYPGVKFVQDVLLN